MLKAAIRHLIYEACISAFFDVLTRNRNPKLSHKIYTQPKRMSNDPRKVSVVNMDSDPPIGNRYAETTNTIFITKDPMDLFLDTEC